MRSAFWYVLTRFLLCLTLCLINGTIRLKYYKGEYTCSNINVSCAVWSLKASPTVQNTATTAVTRHRSRETRLMPKRRKPALPFRSEANRNARYAARPLATFQAFAVSATVKCARSTARRTHTRRRAWSHRLYRAV